MEERDAADVQSVDTGSLLVESSPRVAEPASNAQPAVLVGDAPAPAPGIGFFEKYLSLWVLICIVVGAVIGYFAPVVTETLSRAQFAEINAVVAVLLWIMIFPMLIQARRVVECATRSSPR